MTEKYKRYTDVPVAHLEKQTIKCKDYLNHDFNGEYRDIYNPSTLTINLERLNEFFDQNPEYDRNKIELDIDGYEYDNHYVNGLIVFYSRIETDYEFKKRVQSYQKYIFSVQRNQKKAEKKKLDVRERELKELERLKKKYEGQ